ncbi:hypothetical protein CLAFUW4_12403 [Fulvia fulva]|uniref:Uncharacterized protein n=1 Tax=Passalora fulva TaxID=5499 RepID=A0A9Q8PE17_PASFU|nr:uncharacterized protein CLAFUR5_11431 [Fulvia fulva]KAK4617555.1 hypothetical protein CLAFUR4_12408 [Fulvia fulva]KAK4618630.1 hypothetical protein CLAFUR0_12419 [Fulvia fulva]UJO20743.1 hypothetical protein CLAFUR5_11431 [Fulvia fulva]WPV17885.1 hypothetical protein CLAFUW4_12403 [Fulvia fulva]WPV33190.1 hypothetical protein CLAFUW7_12410 [Fulvia fulva]
MKRETLEHIFQQHHDPAAHDSEDSVGLLNEDEKRQTSPSPLQGKFANSRNRKVWLYLALFGIALILIALALPTKRIRGIELPFIPATPASHLRQEDHFLHIVIPQIWSPVGTVELCKTLLTASTLDYPTPWTVSWNSTVDADGEVANAALNKIQHVSAWLNGMPEEREDDLVAILGNNKSWFQVRPEVLLKRYLGILEKANKELSHKYPSDVLETREIGERVVFATEEQCPSEDAGRCQAVEAGGKSVHYLSADFSMGVLKDVKLLWQHAASKALQLTVENATFDEYTIFASLMSEQEQYRQEARQSRRQEERQNDHGTSIDFGMTLDFKQELSYAAPSNTDETEWIKHIKTSKREVRKWTSPPDLYLPKDITASEPPFWTVDGAEVPQNATWHDVQLLTTTATNVVPAIVQRGPHSDPLLAQGWWKKMWFQPYARRLLDTFVLTPLMPVAVLAGMGGNETRYWSPHWQRIGVMQAENVKFKKWNDVCNAEEMAQALFLDGEGSWVDPRP